MAATLVEFKHTILAHTLSEWKLGWPSGCETLLWVKILHKAQDTGAKSTFVISGILSCFCVWTCTSVSRLGVTHKHIVVRKSFMMYSVYTVVWPVIMLQCCHMLLLTRCWLGRSCCDHTYALQMQSTLCVACGIAAACCSSYIILHIEQQPVLASSFQSCLHFWHP